MKALFLAATLLAAAIPQANAGVSNKNWVVCKTLDPFMPAKIKELYAALTLAEKDRNWQWMHELGCFHLDKKLPYTLTKLHFGKIAELKFSSDLTLFTVASAMLLSEDLPLYPTR